MNKPKYGFAWNLMRIQCDYQDRKEVPIPDYYKGWVFTKGAN